MNVVEIARVEAGDEAGLATFLEMRIRLFESFACMAVIGTAAGSVCGCSGANDWDRAAMRAADAAYFGSALTTDEAAVWLARRGEDALGSVALSFYRSSPKPWYMQERYAYLSSMYVTREERGHGLGRHLLTAALDHARASGVTSVSLHATEAGRPLYAKVGFSETGEMRLIAQSCP